MSNNNLNIKDFLVEARIQNTKGNKILMQKWDAKNLHYIKHKWYSAQTESNEHISLNETEVLKKPLTIKCEKSYRNVKENVFNMEYHLRVDPNCPHPLLFLLLGLPA